MSSRASIFLTDDNIHWYEETNDPNYDESGKFIGNNLVLEFPTDVNVEQSLDGTIVILKPGNDLYKLIMKMKQL